MGQIQPLPGLWGMDNFYILGFYILKSIKSRITLLIMKSYMHFKFHCVQMSSLQQGCPMYCVKSGCFPVTMADNQEGEIMACNPYNIYKVTFSTKEAFLFPCKKDIVTAFSHRIAQKSLKFPSSLSTILLEWRGRQYWQDKIWQLKQCYCIW